MDIWFEKAAEYSGRATDQLWSEMNTFPMFRLNITYYTPAEAGIALVALVTNFFADTAAIWPASKPKKWILLIVGPDGQGGGRESFGVVANPGDYLPLQVEPDGVDVVGPYHDTSLIQQGIGVST